MKISCGIGLLLCLASLLSVTICIFTDWNDSLFLSLALGLSLVVNVWNVLRFWGKRSGEELKR